MITNMKCDCDIYLKNYNISRVFQYEKCLGLLTKFSRFITYKHTFYNIWKNCWTDESEFFFILN